MEYTFRNSMGEEPCTISLFEFHFTLKAGSREESVSYASLVEVQIERQRDRFRTCLYVDQHRPIIITNRLYTSRSSFEDQSRLYATFVRVLHFHLKAKCKAVYTAGNRTTQLWAEMISASMICFAIAFAADYLGIRLASPLMEGATLSALSVALIIASKAGLWPSHYSPTDIPLEFLP